MTHPQLFDAGPIRVQPSGNGSHKRAIIPAQCAEPGCTKPRRRAQGARYCEDHARSIGYRGKVNQSNAGNEYVACPRCNENFRRKRQVYGNMTAAVATWRMFCPECTKASPLSRQALKNHNVPHHVVHAWLMLGDELRCEFPGCGRRLLHNSKNHGNRNAGWPCIDHDHSCCPESRSCGQCIRGVICSGCNTMLGCIETLLQRASMTEIHQYIAQRALPPQQPQNAANGPILLPMRAP